ncbi:MAG TPA: hypothetical protein VG826_05505 [Pirellulales bacterium]|nr:hypothetical protein [Pirellulales bacterium]
MHPISRDVPSAICSLPPVCRLWFFGFFHRAVAFAIRISEGTRNPRGAYFPRQSACKYLQKDHMPRFYYVDSKKLKQLRIEGGWKELEDFALDAKVEPETVRRAESHGRNFKKTIQAFARVLRVENWEDLLAPPRVQQGFIVIEIELDQTKEEFRKSDILSSLARDIEKNVDLRNDIKKLSIRYSSVFVHLLCHHDDAVAFLAALITGGLNSLRACSIRFRKSDIVWSGTFLGEGPELHFIDGTGMQVILGTKENMGSHNIDTITFNWGTVEAWGYRRIGGWFHRLLYMASFNLSHLSVTMTEDVVEFTLKAKKPIVSLPTP